jgi:hypothetical protein
MFYMVEYEAGTISFILSKMPNTFWSIAKFKLPYTISVPSFIDPGKTEKKTTM